MSNLVYPVLPGLMFGATRTPIWSSIVKTSVNGREFRSANFQIPRYRYTLQYEFLRSAAAWAELQTLFGFYNQLLGGWDTFLFSDPDDNAVTAQAFGVGDGSTLTFQLVRSLGGFVEPVYALNGTPTIYVNGTPTTPASISATGLVTFSAAPAAAAAITWTGSFYWRCRFADDSLEFEKFMAQLWAAKKVVLMTCKP